jgi:hypothetical protein
VLPQDGRVVLRLRAAAVALMRCVHLHANAVAQLQRAVAAPHPTTLPATVLRDERTAVAVVLDVCAWVLTPPAAGEPARLGEPPCQADLDALAALQAAAAASDAVAAGRRRELAGRSEVLGWRSGGVAVVEGGGGFEREVEAGVAVVAQAAMVARHSGSAVATFF